MEKALRYLDWRKSRGGQRAEVPRAGCREPEPSEGSLRTSRTTGRPRVSRTNRGTRILWMLGEDILEGRERKQVPGSASVGCG